MEQAFEISRRHVDLSTDPQNSNNNGNNMAYLDIVRVTVTVGQSLVLIAI